MKALSLTQPWATLVANGSKRIETRSWSTSYRGLIAIHASKGFPGYARECCYSRVFQGALRINEGGQFYVSDLIKSLPLGSIIATANLVDCVTTNYPMSFSFDGTRMRPLSNSPEFAFGDYSANRFMWFLEGVRKLPAPVPCKGALSLWEVPQEILDQVEKQLTPPQ
jgi:hypothetical protein